MFSKPRPPDLSPGLDSIFLESSVNHVFGATKQVSGISDEPCFFDIESLKFLSAWFASDWRLSPFLLSAGLFKIFYSRHMRIIWQAGRLLQ